MPKQSFGQLYFDMKESIRLQKQKDLYEKRKKLLKDNLKKRKKRNLKFQNLRNQNSLILVLRF